MSSPPHTHSHHRHNIGEEHTHIHTHTLTGAPDTEPWERGRFLFFSSSSLRRRHHRTTTRRPSIPPVISKPPRAPPPRTRSCRPIFTHSTGCGGSFPKTRRASASTHHTKCVFFVVSPTSSTIRTRESVSNDPTDEYFSSQRPGDNKNITKLLSRSA